VKATDDVIHVRADSTAADGSKLEPEEKLVQRRIGVEVTTMLGNGPTGGTPIPAAMRSGVSADLTAAEAAAILSRTCCRCAFWDRAGWQQTRKAWNDPSNHEGFTTLNKIRAEFLSGHAPRVDSDLEAVESAIAEDLAICRALTEAHREVTLTAFSGCCPAALDSGEPFADTFRPRAGGESKKAATAAYDTILGLAQGRGLR
jgi:hypothetical protein